MKTFKKLMISGLLALSLAVTAETGQTAAAGSAAAKGGTALTADAAAKTGFTLEEARKEALASSKTLRKAGLSVQSARLTEKIQGFDLLPSVSVSTKASLGYPTTSGTTVADLATATAGVGVSQTLYDGGLNATTSKVNGIATRAAEEDLRSASLDILNQTDSAYYAVLEAQAALEAAQSDLDSSRVHLALAQAKLEAGIIIKSDFLKTESETTANETALGLAKRNLSVAMIKLSSLTGHPLPLALQTIDFSRYTLLMQRLVSLDDAAIDRIAAALVSTAAGSNPTLLGANLARDKAEASVDVEKTASLPTVSASWTHNLSYSVSQGADIGTGSIALGASLSLDPWTVGANVEKAKVAASEAALDYGEDERTIALSLQSALFDGISSARSVFSSQKALDYAEEHYRSVLELYRLSSSSSSDLSDAETLVSTNRNTLISARYQFLTNLSSLENLTGLGTEDALVSLIQ
jgi:outer membrane protein